jgi:peptide/nickel transport system permease protein
VPDVDEAPERATMNRARTFVRLLFTRPQATLGVSILLLFVLLALFGPYLVPHDPTEFLARPHQPPTAQFWFGTTGEGKDVFSQTIVGTRISLCVGLGTGLCVTGIGALIGVVAAYVGGVVDDVIHFVINVFLILPGLPLAVVLAAYLPQGPFMLGVVLVISGWAWNARVLRAQALSLRQRDFVLAAIVSGESHLRIVLFEILPNLGSLLFSTFISASIYAIGAQVGLEFLGLGDVSVVTWGTNLYWAQNSSALLLSSWWAIVPTGTCVALLGFALTLLNGAVDELANPALRASRTSSSGLLLTPVRPREAAHG